jgi:hypothetical protein
VAALFGSSADFATGMPLDTTFRITGAALYGCFDVEHRKYPVQESTA